MWLVGTGNVVSGTGNVVNGYRQCGEWVPEIWWMSNDMVNGYQQCG
jgi:hypothetical protein